MANLSSSIINFAVDCLVASSNEFNEVVPHSCGHHAVADNITLFNLRHEKHILATKAIRDFAFFINEPTKELYNSQPQTLRITPDYQLGGLNPALKDFVSKKLVPIAISILESTIKVKHPVKGRLSLPRYCTSYYPSHPEKCLEYQPSSQMNDPEWAYCGHAKHKDQFFASYEVCKARRFGHPSSGFVCERHESGGKPETDFYLYVTAVESEYCQSALGYAMYCSLDLDTNRPLAGSINLCPSSLSLETSSFQTQVEVTVHELLHSLIFTESLFEKFIDDFGRTIPKEQVIQSSRRHGHLVKSIVSPKVVKKTKEHFGCASISGADLEDEGGQGTAGNHWETRIFNGELMDGMAGFSSFSDRHAMSPITLALMEDSGWYTVNWKRAGHLSWGKGAGCSFAQDSCQTYASKHPTQPWFCDQDGQETCTATASGFGSCATGLLLNSCKVINLYTNADCKVLSKSSNSAVDWGVRSGSDAYCLVSENPTVQEYTKGRSRYRTTKSPRNGDCFQMECHRDGTYSIKMLGQKIACHHEGQVVHFPDYFSQFTAGGVKCPHKDLVCKTSNCPDGCSGNGWCWNRRCICQVGFGGTTCARRVCNSRSGYCRCDILPGETSGLCLPGTEMLNVNPDLSNPQTTTTDHKLQFTINIRGSDFNFSQSGLKNAIASILDDVSPKDVSIHVAESIDSEPSWPIAFLINGVMKIGITVNTQDPQSTAKTLENAEKSTELYEALLNVGIDYIQGSLTFSPTKEASGHDSKSRSTMIILGIAGFIVFAIVIGGIALHARWKLTQMQKFTSDWQGAKKHPLAKLNTPYSDTKSHFHQSDNANEPSITTRVSSYELIF